jgi:hypothetical protein
MELNQPLSKLPIGFVIKFERTQAHSTWFKMVKIEKPYSIYAFQGVF